MGSHRSLPGVLEQAIADRVIPGAVYRVSRHGRVVAHGAVGNRALKPRREAATEDTIYDCASVTKPVAGATAFMILRQQGKIKLDDRVRRFYPKAPAAIGKVTMLQLLTHVSGLPAWAALYRQVTSPEQLIQGILQMKLQAPPGTKHTYSCLGYLLLGAIMQQVAEETLDDLLRREVYGPLGMVDTGYRPPKHLRPRIAPAGWCQWRGRDLRGEVHDQNAGAMNGIAANAGLFSTTRDLTRFGQMILRGGESILTRESIRYLTHRQTPKKVAFQAVGWWLNGNDMIPTYPGFSPQTIGHTGFTGTSVVIDLSAELIVVLLANRTLLGEPAFVPVRRRFHRQVQARAQR